jgi:hypothetical protein
LAALRVHRKGTVAKYLRAAPSSFSFQLPHTVHIIPLPCAGGPGAKPSGGEREKAKRAGFTG